MAALQGLTDGTFRARWLRDVIRSPRITDAVRALLMTVGVEDMDETGRFSVPREDLAARMSRGKARVSERLQSAVDAGLVARLSAGKKGSTAVYAGLVNGSACPDLIEDVELPDVAGKGPEKRTESDDSKGPANRSESEHFGSGLQDALAETKGPHIRTGTLFGSGLQDAEMPDGVRVGGPKGEKKGPVSPDANVVKEVQVGEVTNGQDPPNKLGGGAEQKAKRRRASSPKIAFPADFAISDEMRVWAQAKVPLVDIELETELFIRYWLGKPLVKRPGWVRTWEVWMLRGQKWTQERVGNVHQLRPAGDPRFMPGSGARLDPNATYTDDHAEVFGS